MKNQLKFAFMRIAPLALIAVSAQAAAIFNITGTDCFSGGQIGAQVAPLVVGPGNTLVANQLPTNGGVQGAVLNGACSGSTIDGNILLEASMFGNFAGSDMPLPASVPVEFDFTAFIPEPGFIEIFDWYVELYINNVNYFATSGSSSTNPSHIVGSGNSAVLPAGVLDGGDTWYALVGVDCWVCEGDLTIDLGTSSLRINPAAATVPEPSTISLFALGGVLLWFKRRRRA